MPNLTDIVSTPADHAASRSTHFLLRLTLCVVVTAMNIAAVVYSAPILYRVSVHHPVWLAGASLLFGSLVLSLLRVWVTTLPHRVR